MGSRIHTHIGKWAEGKQVETTSAEDPYLDGFLAFCRSTRPVWLATERAVVSSLGYGGRFDLMGEVRDIPTLLDAKTGKHYALELSMQLAAYRFADGMVVYDPDGQAVGVEPMPYIERCAGLYLDGRGTAQMIEVDADEKAFASFCHLLEVRKWADSLKVKAS